jgi:hypothetical protein
MNHSGEMNMTQPITKSTPDLNEKLAAARGYGYAQQALMEAIVEGRASHVITHGLDVMRTSGAIFNSTNPMGTRFEEDLTPRLIEDTAEFLRLFAVIKQTEKLIGDWLATSEREGVPTVIHYVDRALGIDADPRHDIFVVAGEEATTVAATLRDRGYVRVLEWAGLMRDDDASQLDVGRTDAVLESIQNLSICRPGRVWLLWGPGAQCPESAKSALDERLRKAFMNRNTVGSLGERWAQQFIANIPTLARRGKDIRGLQNAFAGCGAVVVGAGPSLDESIAWIRDQKVRPVVLCSYKAVKALVRGGVTPDFIVMLDPKQGAHHLADVDLKGVAAIITEIAVDPESLGQSDVPVLPYCSGTDTQSLIAAFGDVEIPLVRSGGSVMHVALQAARIMGCTRISLAGVDFGFPSDQLYATGAGVGDELRLSADRRSYVRRAKDGNGRSGLLIGALANDGGVIPSTIELDHYRGWTEQFIRDCHRNGLKFDVFNLSRTGARLEGATFVEHLAEHVASEIDVDAKSVVARLAPLMPAKTGKSSVTARLRSKAKALRQLGKTCDKAVAAARDGKASDMTLYGRVAEQAVACPEVSLVLTRRLQVIDDQVRRSTVDVPERLRELAEVTSEEAVKVAMLYADAARRMTRSSSASHR